MKKLNILTIIFLLVTQVFAYASTPAFTHASEENENLEIHIEEMGFNQNLTILLLEGEGNRIDISIQNGAKHLVYSTSLSTQDRDVFEIDLSSLPSGTYLVGIKVGSETKMHHLIKP
ncbi:MAG: hypothetical protein AAF694_15850 [Bacteroidota bacterium]